MTRRAGRYLAGQAGRDAYAAQAARNAGPRGDPQRTSEADPRAYRDAACAPCPHCPHHVIVHELDGAGRRGACTVAEAGGPCGCTGHPPLA